MSYHKTIKSGTSLLPVPFYSICTLSSATTHTAPCLISFNLSLVSFLPTTTFLLAHFFFHPHDSFSLSSLPHTRALLSFSYCFIALNRKLLSAFYIEGKEYEFNFSKFWTNTRTKFNCYETDDEVIWHIEQKTWNNKVIVDISCNKKEMLLINYEAPNGKKLHNRLWNGGTGKGTIKLYHKGKLVDEILAENVGCEYGEYDKK